MDREGALPPKEGSAELRAAAERGALELTAWGHHTFGGWLTSVGRDIGKRVGDTRGARLYPWFVQEVPLAPVSLSVTTPVLTHSQDPSAPSHLSASYPCPPFPTLTNAHSHRQNPALPNSCALVQRSRAGKGRQLKVQGESQKGCFYFFKIERESKITCLKSHGGNNPRGRQKTMVQERGTC